MTTGPTPFGLTMASHRATLTERGEPAAKPGGSIHTPRPVHGIVACKRAAQLVLCGPWLFGPVGRYAACAADRGDGLVISSAAVSS